MGEGDVLAPVILSVQELSWQALHIPACSWATRSTNTESAEMNSKRALIPAGPIGNHDQRTDREISLDPATRYVKRTGCFIPDYHSCSIAQDRYGQSSTREPSMERRSQELAVWRSS